jgi:hypothetical protein
MSRLHTPLIPLVLLAGIVAASACSEPRGAEEAPTRLIPPAIPLAHAAEPAAPPSGAVAVVAPVNDAPSPEDVKEFQRGVGK